MVLELVAGCVSLSLAATCAWADAKSIVFRLATDRLRDGDTKLANGIEVKISDWPALVIANDPESEAATCTASLVGPNVLLLAAHCLDKGPGSAVRTSSFRMDDREVGLECEMHPEYAARKYLYGTPRSSSDYALCFIDYKGRVPRALSRIEFEVLETAALKVDDSVLMTGYGCSAVLIKNGKPVPKVDFGALRIGNGKIARTSYGVFPYASFLRIFSKPDADPTLCPGDSGGPLFSGVTAEAPRGPRRIRGINSILQAEKQGNGYVFVSNIAPVADPSFVGWAKKWLRPDTYICGINRKAGELPCRS